MDQVAEHWNSHTIRPTKNRNVPNGRPMMMYSLPEFFGAANHIYEVRNDQLDISEGECIMEHTMCDETVLELCNLILSRHSISKPQSASDLTELYLYLRDELLTLLGT